MNTPISPMSDSEQLSALLDGEVSTQDVDVLIDRLLTDTEWQSQWIAYHRQADALRFPQAPSLDNEAFAARLHAMLDQEPQQLSHVRAKRNAAVALERRMSDWKRYLMPGAAMAAAVAAVTWVSIAQFGIEPGQTGVTVIAGGTGSPTTPVPAPMAVSSAGAVDAAAADPTLQEYLLAHQQFAPASQWHGVAPFVRVTSVAQSSQRKAP